MKNIIVTDKINITTIGILLQRNGPVQCIDNPIFHEACLLLLHHYYTAEAKMPEGSISVQLKAQYLRENIGKKPGTNNFYLDVVNALHKSSILTRDNIYLVGNYSMSYYLDYTLDGIKFNYEPQTKIIRNKIKESKIEVHYQQQCLKRLTYNLAGAADIQDKLYYIERKNKNHIWQQIEARDFYAKVDDFGRIHTNLTRLPRLFRQFLSFQGQGLHSVDMSCAQPFLLSKLLLQKYLGQDYHLFPVDLSLLPSGVMRFIDDVTSGSLYNKFAQSLNLQFTDDTGGVGKDYVYKTEFKISMIAIIFYGKFPERRHKYLIKFEKLYPEVYTIVMEYRKTDYKFLPQTLQTIESKIFNEAIDGLAIRYPETVFLRLHDCIITASAYTQLVKIEIEIITLKLIGIVPKIKVDQFNVDSEKVQERNPKSYLFQIIDGYELKKRFNKKLRKYPSRLLDKLSDEDVAAHPDPGSLAKFNYPAEYYRITKSLNWEMDRLQARYTTQEMTVGQVQ